MKQFGCMLPVLPATGSENVCVFASSSLSSCDRAEVASSCWFLAGRCSRWTNPSILGDNSSVTPVAGCHARRYWINCRMLRQPRQLGHW